MAYKTDKTSKELKIMLNENTVESCAIFYYNR